MVWPTCLRVSTRGLVAQGEIWSIYEILIRHCSPAASYATAHQQHLTPLLTSSILRHCSPAASYATAHHQHLFHNLFNLFNHDRQAMADGCTTLGSRAGHLIISRTRSPDEVRAGSTFYCILSAFKFSMNTQHEFATIQHVRQSHIKPITHDISAEINSTTTKRDRMKCVYK